MNKKQEIKNRIDLINKGEVPEGYKKEHGYCIPQEWELTRFNKLFNRITRKNNIGCDNVLTISAQHGLINQQKFFKKNIASSDTSNYFLLEKGDFAYNKSYSAGYPYGTIKKLKLYDKGIVSPLYICFNIKANTANSEYIEQYFDANKFNSEILAIAQEGARNHGLLNMGIDDFFNCNIIYPPKQEQEKIAEILSCCDKVIELKEQLLISKKKEIKELKRDILFNLCNDWNSSTILDLTSYENSNLTITEAMNQKDGEYNIYDANSCIKKSTRYLFEREYISIVKDGAGVGRLKLCEGKSSILATMGAIFANESINTSFLYHSMQMLNFNRLISGSTIPHIYYKDYCKFKISFPRELDKQKHIANAFSKIDFKISLLEQELEQYKQLKKSLSQLLLTGIVRVNEV